RTRILPIPTTRADASVRSSRESIFDTELKNENLCAGASCFSGVPGWLSSTLFERAGQDHNAERAVRVQYRRRLCPGELHTIRSVPEKACAGIRTADRPEHRKVLRRTDDVCRNHHVAGKLQKTGSVQGDSQPPVACRRCDRCAGEGPGG